MVTAIAHRGDPVRHRENTLAAFEAAVDAGAPMVELDLRRTADGEIVVLHDHSLLRLWGVDRDVTEADWAEVEQLGEGDLRIPSFRQLLTSIEVSLMVDFTGPEVVAGAVDLVRRAGAMERSLFVSGHVEALAEVRGRAPEAHIGLTWIDQDLPGPDLMARLGAEFWNPMHHLVQRRSVDEMHERGHRVSTWTVDEPEDMVRVTEAGVDAIVSNRIRELLAFLDQSTCDPDDSDAPIRT
jgi:glycerophosphoryl diester phosphodiesterase